MKLKEYSLFAAGILAAGNSSNQTFYHDINPDLQLEHDDLNWFNFAAPLDLNHDGVNDFDFKLWGYSTYSGWSAQGHFIFGYAVPKAGHQVLIASSQSPGWCTFGWFADNFDHIANYSNGEIISPTPATGTFLHPVDEFYKNQLLFMVRDKPYFASTWYAFCTGVPNTIETGGLWFEAEMKMMPIKFKQGANFYTGWIRLSATEGNLYVHDYAIDLTAGTSVIAGDITGAIISEVPEPGLVTTNSTKAILTWGGVPNAIKYRYRYREIGATDWITKIHSGTAKILKSLDCATTYEWQIQAIYDNVPEMNSEWSDLNAFSTLACRIGDAVSSVKDIVIYPTIASEQITVKTTSEDDHVDLFIEMYNLQGVQVKSIQTNSKSFELEVNDLPAGAYIVLVNYGESEHITEKVIVTR